MRKRKSKTNLGLYTPPNDGASYSEKGVQKEDGVEKTESSQSAQDSVEGTKRKNKKKETVNLGIF